MHFPAALLLSLATLATAGPTQLRAWYGADCDTRFGTYCNFETLDPARDWDICCGVGMYNWQSFELVSDNPNATLTAYTGYDNHCDSGVTSTVGVGECKNLDLTAKGWELGAVFLSLHSPASTSLASTRRRSTNCKRADSEVLMIPHEDGQSIVYRRIPVGREVEVAKAMEKRDFEFLRGLPEVGA